MDASEKDRILTELVAKADPQPDPDLATVEQVWSQLAAETSRATPMIRPKRWRPPLVLGSVVAVALAASAAAIFIPTRTGIQQPAAEVEAGGPGEVWRLDGTDFAEQLAKISTDIPFPSAEDRAAALSRLAAESAQDGSDHDVSSTTGAIRAEVARRAICSWTVEWSDETERPRATAELRGALSWPAVTDVDPHPAMDGDHADGGNGPTVFGQLPGIVAAAEAADASALQAGVKESGWCVLRRIASPTDQPVRPSGPPPEEPAPTTAPKSKR